VTGKARGWATGGLGSPVKPARPDAAPGSLPDAPAPAPASAADAGELVAPWLPTIGRMLLGLVFVWFGWHEVVQPGRWTQYVPVIAENSRPATVLVAVHGWVLLALAAALLLGIAPRISAVIASVLLLEIVISLLVTGFSDTAMRDVGVLGLAVVLTGCKHQRLVMRL
jgi:uncharacterized membrane protein YphA (DoxX/SURF4 family)